MASARITTVGFEKEGLPAKLASFNFSVHGKPIAYFNRSLRRSLRWVLRAFLICRARLSARGGVTPREERVIFLAACIGPGSVCTRLCVLYR